MVVKSAEMLCVSALLSFYWGGVTMNYDRKLKQQQQIIEELIQENQKLKNEKEMLNKEMDDLYRINEIINQELADTRESCEIASIQFEKNATELKSLQEKYRNLLRLTADTKKFYEKKMKNLLKQLKVDL